MERVAIGYIRVSDFGIRLSARAAFGEHRRGQRRQTFFAFGM